MIIINVIITDGDDDDDNNNINNIDWRPSNRNFQDYSQWKIIAILTFPL